MQKRGKTHLCSKFIDSRSPDQGLKEGEDEALSHKKVAFKISESEPDRRK